MDDKIYQWAKNLQENINDVLNETQKNIDAAHKRSLYIIECIARQVLNEKQLKHLDDKIALYDAQGQSENREEIEKIEKIVKEVTEEYKKDGQ